MPLHIFGACCALYIFIQQAAERSCEHHLLTTDSPCWLADLHCQRSQGGAWCFVLFCYVYNLRITPMIQVIIVQAVHPNLTRKCKEVLPVHSVCCFCKIFWGAKWQPKLCSYSNAITPVESSNPPVKKLKGFVQEELEPSFWGVKIHLVNLIRTEKFKLDARSLQTRLSAWHCILSPGPATYCRGSC